MTNRRPKERPPRLRFNADGSVSVISWGCAESQNVLVELPSQRGRYIWCHPCVLVVACRYCDSEIGEPCQKQHTDDGYGAEAHCYRKDDYKTMTRNGGVCTHRAWVE